MDYYKPTEGFLGIKIPEAPNDQSIIRGFKFKISFPVRVTAIHSIYNCNHQRFTPAEKNFSATWQM